MTSYPILNILLKKNKKKGDDPSPWAEAVRCTPRRGGTNCLVDVRSQNEVIERIVQR